MKVHDIKIEELHFSDVEKGIKKSELRLNDREYKAGDVLMMREWNPLIGLYTDRVIHAVITHVYPGPNLPKDYVILSLRLMK
jgi:hypothetical protein